MKATLGTGPIPVDVTVAFDLDPAEDTESETTMIANSDAPFRPAEAAVRLKAGGWVVLVRGPLIRKDGTLGQATRVARFGSDKPAPSWVVQLVADARAQVAALLGAGE